eukprot:tig00000492_g1436.t1
MKEGDDHEDEDFEDDGSNFKVLDETEEEPPAIRREREAKERLQRIDKAITAHRGQMGGKREKERERMKPKLKDLQKQRQQANNALDTLIAQARHGLTPTPEGAEAFKVSLGKVGRPPPAPPRVPPTEVPDSVVAPVTPSVLSVVFPVTPSVPPTEALAIVVVPVTPRVPPSVVFPVTPRVPPTEALANVVAPVTPRVPPNVVLPVTPSVPPTEALASDVAPVTPRVPPSVVAPVTSSVPPPARPPAIALELTCAGAQTCKALGCPHPGPGTVKGRCRFGRKQGMMCRRWFHGSCGPRRFWRYCMEHTLCFQAETGAASIVKLAHRGKLAPWEEEELDSD